MRVKSTLREVTQFVSRGKTPLYAESSDFKIINQACVFPQSLRLENLKYVSKEFWDSLKEEKKLLPDDILVNSTGTGTLGRIGFVGEGLSANTTYDSHVMVVRIDSSHYCPKFFFYLFQDEM